MKLKAYSFLFCALLANTAIHEIRAGFTPKLIGNKKRSADPVLHYGTEYTNDSIVAEHRPRLAFLANTNANLWAIANLTANVGIILDMNENLVAIINGDSGSAVVISIESYCGYYVSTGLWVTFDDFLTSRTPGWSSHLKNFADAEFKVSQATPDILEAVNGVVQYLLHVDLELEADPQAGLEFVIIYGNKVIPYLNGVLQGYVEAIESTGGITVEQDLAGTYNVFEAFAIIFGTIRGGLKGAIKAGANLNLQAIGDAGNGLNFLTTIMLQLGNSIDIGKDLGGVLNNLDSFLELVALLGGMENTGVSGLFKVLHRVVDGVYGGARTTTVINTFAEFLAPPDQTQKGNLSSELSASLSALLKAVREVNASWSLSGLVNIVRALQTGKLELRGVNLSRIVNELLTGANKGVPNLLKVLVTLSLELSPINGEPFSLLSCLLALILDVTSPVGIQLLQGLGIVGYIDLDTTSGSLIDSILKPVPNLDTTLRTENLYEVLIALPVFGNIVKDLSEAISIVTSKRMELGYLLNGSIRFQNFIAGTFQLLGRIPLGIKANTIDHIRELLNTFTSVNLTYGIDSSVVFDVIL